VRVLCVRVCVCPHSDSRFKVFLWMRFCAWEGGGKGGLYVQHNDHAQQTQDMNHTCAYTYTHRYICIYIYTQIHTYERICVCVPISFCALEIHTRIGVLSFLPLSASLCHPLGLSMGLDPCAF